MCQKENTDTFKSCGIPIVVFYRKQPLNTNLSTFSSYPRSLYSLLSLLSHCECRMLPEYVTSDQGSLVLIPSSASDFISLSGSGKATPAHDTHPEMKILLIG